MCRRNTTLFPVKPTNNLAASASPDGETLLLQEHDGEYFLKVGGVPLMSTTACSSEQMMAELACGAGGRTQRVLIGGLGIWVHLAEGVGVSFGRFGCGGG